MVTRHGLLKSVHEGLLPRSYLEIGINKGKSLALSRTRTIAVDPAFKITEEVNCDVRVAKATSDDFFARDGALDHFAGGVADLTLIDGLHLFEFALRDFMNAERCSVWTSVIVIDDVFPRSVAEASRDRGTMGAWTGDVFKLTQVLRDYRPDLLLLPLDTNPTGVLVVLGADPTNTILRDSYDEIIARLVVPDPQTVPVAVLDREDALLPGPVVASALWSELARAREDGVSREDGFDAVRKIATEASQPAPKRELTPAALRARPVSPTLSAGNRGRAGASRSAAGSKIRRRLRPLARRVRAVQRRLLR